MSGNSGARVLGGATSISGATLVAYVHESMLQHVLIIITLLLAAIVVVIMVINRLYRKFSR